MEMKIRFSNNLIQLDIASLLMFERVKALPIFCLTEFLVSDQHAAKQNFSWDKSSPSGIQLEALYLQPGDYKKGFAINPSYRYCLEHWKQ